ncbi:MAG: hypothetical protein ABFR75_04770 [Acidobacteriota bacterium]
MPRKLIKPDLDGIKKHYKKDTKKRTPPPYKTHAENYYYLKQMNNKTLLSFELVDGEVIKGTIEWYDEKCLKIKRSDGSNIIAFKHYIKFIHKNPDPAQDKVEEK